MVIETPAAALSARKIGEHADFFGFGTYDLTQYAFATDRDNAALDQYFDAGADAIFRRLEIGHHDAPDVPLSVCGELAGRPEHIPKLLQRGIRAVSAASPLVPIIKEAIRGASRERPVTRGC